MVFGSTQIFATRPKFSRSLLPAFLPERADLHQELAVLGELEQVRVLLAVAADPDVALVVDVDAVVGLRPFVARSGAAPGAHQVALGIEHEHRRRGSTALGNGRIELSATLVVMQPAGAAMDDPDVVLLVDPDADGPAEQPVVGQRLRPQRIDLEHRRGDTRALRLGLALQHRLADAERHDGRGEHGGRI